jgi:DNA invertase Pin-like site-specific DNA recombinase
MINKNLQKVTSDHLRRKAYLYVRQSTLKQVIENTESTKRQYAIRDRAIALGWPLEQIDVIDSDLGQSGAKAEDREGFKKLVTEVGMGNAGIVIGLEVSRLARNNLDWHRLLEICALTNTLILDEDGLYDPGHFNDRLLLGLKGTMSEAELHVLKGRLHGGILAKAERGELRVPLPVGFIYNAANKVTIDPDKQVQKSIHLFFDTFNRVGSASGTVKYFRRNGFKFPRKLLKGPNKGEVVWGDLVFSRALAILHNPRYAGAFFYGRTRIAKFFDGKTKYKKLPRDQWHVLLKDKHEGYICWDKHEENLRRLQDNAQANGTERKKSPPREGPALLQGIVMCGVCGSRMTVRYHTRAGKRKPDYRCQKQGISAGGERFCQNIAGGIVDDAIGKLLIESVSPMALEVALNVQKELNARLKEADQLRKQNVKRARYEADLSRRRYMQVDPANRLVADSLEADWNDKLRILTEVQQEYERQRKSDRMIFNSKERSRILTLAADFPNLWRNPKTLDREKKRMVRLVLEDVTLIKDSGITVHVRFKGGIIRTLNLPAPKNGWQLRMTSKAVVSKIDHLLDQHTDNEVANILNNIGMVSGSGQPFKARTVFNIRRSYGLKSHYGRLRDQGLFTLNEIVEKLKVSKRTVKKWSDNKKLTSYKCNDKNERVYEWPGKKLINKFQVENREASQRRKVLLNNCQTV